MFFLQEQIRIQEAEEEHIIVKKRVIAITYVYSLVI